MMHETSKGTAISEEIKKAVEDALKGMPGFSALLDTAQSLPKSQAKDKDSLPDNKEDQSGGN